MCPHPEIKVQSNKDLAKALVQYQQALDTCNASNGAEHPDDYNAPIIGRIRLTWEPPWSSSEEDNHNLTNVLE